MRELKINNPLEKYGIEVISSEHPEFYSMIKDYHGEAEEILEFIDSIKPFPLFVKNSSEVHICATSFNWILNARNGEQIISPTGNINMGFINNKKPVPSDRIKSYSEIPSQGSKFYSYISLPFDLLQKSKLFKERGGGHSGSYNISQKELLHKNFIGFAFSVEGILLSDGRFIGEDRNFMFGTVSGILRAGKAFSKKIKEMQGEGLSDNKIIEKAQAKSGKPPFPPDWVNPPKTLKESFKRSYTQTVDALRATIFRQKTMSQLSEEQIVNMAINNQYKSDFEIRRIK